MENIKTLQNQKYIKSLVVIILGTALLTVSAKFKIPFYPVPMTMQTFMVLFFGIAFGYKIGLSIVGLYLVEGIIGLPVFSNSPERGVGITYFTGPTMGYLIGFIPAVFFSGLLKVNYNYNLFVRFILNFVLYSFSISFVYIFGLIWLNNFVQADQLLAFGVLPFLPAEILKILILSVAITLFNKDTLSWRSLR